MQLMAPGCDGIGHFSHGETGNSCQSLDSLFFNPMGASLPEQTPKHISVEHLEEVRSRTLVSIGSAIASGRDSLKLNCEKCRTSINSHLMIFHA